MVGTAQYLATRYTERLAEAGIEPSAGSIRDSYDNALAETVIGLLKTEVIRPQGPWRTLEAVAFATLEWMDRSNHRRLLEPIGHIPLAEAEAAAAYYAQIGMQPRAAQPKPIGRRQTRGEPVGGIGIVRGVRKAGVPSDGRRAGWSGPPPLTSE